MAGFPNDRVAIDNAIGSACLNFRNLMLHTIPELYDYLGTAGSSKDTLLTGAGLSPDEITNMRATASVLNQVSSVMQGKGTIPNPVDVLSFVKPFIGPN